MKIEVSSNGAAGKGSLLTVLTTEDDGPGSLRNAIIESNASAGIGRINFNIGGGQRTIQPLSPLPKITNSVVIDATTQPGYAGRPLIELDGSMAGARVAGLHVSAIGATVRGFVVNGFEADGIRLERAKGCRILGNYVGIDSTGMLARPNALSGIAIIESEGNTIGGVEAGEANLVSGNTKSGILIYAGKDNALVGNLVGTDAGGLTAVGNGSAGVEITAGATGTVVGGAALRAGNVVSGNAFAGITLRESTGSTVIGNLVGTDVTGARPLGNGVSGVTITNARGNTIGGAAPGARNVISGNAKYGINLFGPGAADNRIVGNYIGTDITGTAKLGNARTGILVFNSPRTIIGGAAPGEGNLVSGNGRGGVNIDGSAAHTHVQENWGDRDTHRIWWTSADRQIGGKGYTRDTIVQGNLIGTDASGTRALGNGLHGILLYESQRSTIGGTEPGAANVISGNDRDGIVLLGTNTVGELDCTANVIVGNRIGTDIGGSVAIPNKRIGVLISKASGNTVGGTAQGMSNVISANGEQGVRISGETAFGNRILGNLIGTDATGTLALGNASDGIMINGAPGNTIGGNEAGAANVISGNRRHGIIVSGAAARDNVIRGNHIGVGRDGCALGNAGHGMLITGPAGATMDEASLRKDNIVVGNGRKDVHVSDKSLGNSNLNNAVRKDLGKP